MSIRIITGTGTTQAGTRFLGQGEQRGGTFQTEPFYSHTEEEEGEGPTGFSQKEERTGSVGSGPVLMVLAQF